VGVLFFGVRPAPMRYDVHMGARNGSVALVTGSSRGIGRGTAVELGSLGFSVVVNFVRNEGAARDTAAAVAAAGGDAFVVQADVANLADRQRLVHETLSHFGSIELLVNNAGVPVAERVDLLDASEPSWDRIMATNLKGPYFLTQLVAREMIRLRAEGTVQRPKIINISSVSAYATSTNRGDYCVAKAGMTMMTMLFADRLAEHGIQVFEIRPGVIETDMTAPVKEKYDRLFSEGITPLRRWGQPADVAKIVAAIAQDYLPYSTGEIINVDGGFHMRRL
jgi:NAD(P)-dependent dehydrogenase (short-subunit alcohol dehydrogenase family)